MIISDPQKQRHSGRKSMNLYPLEGSSPLDITGGALGLASGTEMSRANGDPVKIP